MAETIEVRDLERIPFPYLGTLAAYLLGVDVQSKMTTQSYYRHRRELVKYGFHLDPPKAKALTGSRKVTVTEERTLNVQRQG